MLQGYDDQTPVHLTRSIYQGVYFDVLGQVPMSLLYKCGSSHDQVRQLSTRKAELDEMRKKLGAAERQLKDVLLVVAPLVSLFYSCWCDVARIIFCCQIKKASQNPVATQDPTLAAIVKELKDFKCHTWMSKIRVVNDDLGSVALLAQEVEDVSNQMHTKVTAVTRMRECGSMHAVSGLACFPG